MPGRLFSSGSQFYEWKLHICHFFTILGHDVVLRESCVYVNKNKKCQERALGKTYITIPSNKCMSYLYQLLWWWVLHVMFDRYWLVVVLT